MDQRQTLLTKALLLAKASVADATQKSYQSKVTWNKWVIFMQSFHHNPTDSEINCAQASQKQMLELILMFISFCLDSLHQSPPTIPIILSGLRHCLRLKLVDVNVFDHSLIKAARAGVARLP